MCCVPLLGATEKEPQKGQLRLHTALSVSLCSPRGGGFYHRPCGMSQKGLAFRSGPPRLQWFPETSATAEPHCRGTGGRSRVQRGAHQPGRQCGTGSSSASCWALSTALQGHSLSPEERQSHGQGPAQGVGLSRVRELTSFAATLFCTSSCLPSGLQIPPLWPQGTMGTLRHAQTLSVSLLLGLGRRVTLPAVPACPSTPTLFSLFWDALFPPVAPWALQRGQEPLPSSSTPSRRMSSPECRWSIRDGRGRPPSSPPKSEPHC